MENRFVDLMKKGGSPIMVYVFAFMIPLAANMPEMGMAVLALFLEQIIRQSPIRRKAISVKLTWRNPAIWLVLFYLMYVVGLSYSSDMNYGWSDIGMKASLVIIPFYFLLFTINLDWKKLRTFFLFGAFVSIAVNVSLYFYYAETLQHIGFYYFKGEQLSHIMHRGYWAVYLAIAYYFVIYNLIIPSQRKMNVVFSFIQAFILFVFVALSGSKMGLIMVGLVTIWGIIQGIKRVKSKWIFLGAMGCVLIIGVGAFKTDSSLTHRFKKMLTETVKPIQKMDKIHPTSTSARRMTWDASISLIKENFWWGVGTGDVKNVLIQRDQEKGYVGIAKERLNSHNQLLNTQLAIGILGSLFLLLAFGVNFLKNKPNDDSNLRIGIALLLFLAILTESMLETQAGIIPYAFLLCLMSAPSFELHRAKIIQHNQTN